MKYPRLLQHFGCALLLIFAACSSGGGSSSSTIVLESLSPALSVYEPGGTVTAITKDNCAECEILTDGLEASIITYDIVPVEASISSSSNNNRYPTFALPTEPCQGSKLATCTLEINVVKGTQSSNAIVITIRNPTFEIKCAEGQTNVNGVCLNINCLEGFSLQNGKCVPDQIECQKDSDCDEGQECSLTTGLCVKEVGPLPCTKDSQCESSEACINKECTAIDKMPEAACKAGDSCVEGFSCQSGSCKKTGSQPLENGQFCSNNSHCKSNYCPPKKYSFTAEKYGQCQALDTMYDNWKKNIKANAAIVALAHCATGTVNYTEESNKACTVRFVPANNYSECLNDYKLSWDATLNEAKRQNICVEEIGTQKAPAAAYCDKLGFNCGAGNVCDPGLHQCVPQKSCSTHTQCAAGSKCTVTGYFGPNSCLSETFYLTTFEGKQGK